MPAIVSFRAKKTRIATTDLNAVTKGFAKSRNVIVENLAKGSPQNRAIPAKNAPTALRKNNATATANATDF